MDVTLQMVVDEMINRVKDGDLTRDTALIRLRAADIYVGRGTDRRLLRAEATRILRDQDLAHTTA